MSYNKDDVKELIEFEDVVLLLEYFEAEPQVFGDYIVSRTICHNGSSHKMYYYANTQLFRCYTHCDDSFDIFELVLKVANINDLNQAVFWIVNFFNLTHKLNETTEDYSSDDWKIFNKYDKIDSIEITQNKEADFKTYDPKILQYYPQPLIIPWEKEGITKEVCDYMDIHYDPVDGNILIPHKNEDGEIIGIRQRTLVQENEEKYGKYKPWRNGKELYNHPLAFNLYGLDMAKENIKKAEIAIVVEGEKSVLQYISYFGTKNNICVAVCGNTLSKYQFQLLQKYGAKEIVIAFDKDYHTLFEDEYDKVVTHWEKVYNKFASQCNMSVLVDTKDLLDYKNSPMDKGKEIFLDLFRNRYFGG